ncbi:MULTISPECIES: phytoene desaturase family protein [unclassified Streptomyces]|uniref:phytoene desaturase family protein n=1 Tax=unclassified Streptomyces TaxID=2593676 RepID=UPI000DAEC4FE|nr:MULTISPECIES: NAD(P)/FAD-dependent oxidoreductase [unclassified Streptomyces]PZT75932.1 dehydrogenase [Streptomyces sp. AC1-42W]PZT80117.1 dehydrogenase [Streptomyces sp. AC1-42T]
MTDAAVVGTGPNGLAAAVTLARAGLKVALFEQADTIGGGLRTTSLFDSDVVHDICSAIHPMAAASPFFRAFDLPRRGVRLLQPDIPYAHPLPAGHATAAWRSLARTAEHLGPDGPHWTRLMAPLVARTREVSGLLLSNQRALPPGPAAPALLAPRVIAHARRRSPFTTPEARALFAGVAAHAVGRLPSLASAAVAMLLGHTAHSTGWPLPEGGSVRIAEALAADITAHGGTFHTGHRVRDLAELSGIPLIMLDTSPTGLIDLAGPRLPTRYARALARFRHGPGAAKADFLVSGPIPWTHSLPGQAGTVHLGGTRYDIHRAENTTAAGHPADTPFILVVDPAVTDPTRAAAGKRPVWAYAHVPHGDSRDPVDLIRRRIEEHAPGFTDTILASRGIPATRYAAYNPNYIGGDIGGGALTLRQVLARPALRPNPYATPLPGVYLCSASTPPGPSVHGMCGYYAALTALRRHHGRRTAPGLAPA